MTHLSEEELVEYYYREGKNRNAAECHLHDCADCHAAYESLRQDLAELETAPVPERAAGYGESVWQAIRNSAPVYQQERRRFWTGWAAFRYAGAVIVLVVVAFVSGRYWEHARRHPADDAVARQRLVLLVLGDHLDRSERLLVELKHATSPADASAIQTEARELLAENRLYRETASQLKDPMLSSSLDHLERVLVEVANEPDGISEAAIERLQKEMNSNGLLFEIRVLRARVMGEEDRNGSKPKGASI